MKKGIKETIVLDKDGNISFVYRDEGVGRHLVNLKRAQMIRVSDVEFEDGEWVSRLKDGRILCRSRNRGEVVRREHEIIEDMLRRGEPIPGMECPQESRAQSDARAHEAMEVLGLDTYTLLKPKVVAKILGIPESTLGRLRRNREIGYVKLGYRTFRFKPEQVVEYQNKISAPPKDKADAPPAPSGSAKDPKRKSGDRESVPMSAPVDERWGDPPEEGKVFVDLENHLRSFGTHDMMDKGTDEVFPLKELAERVKKMPPEKAKSFLLGLLDDDDGLDKLYGEGVIAKFVGDLISSMDDAPDEWWNKTIEAEEALYNLY